MFFKQCVIPTVRFSHNGNLQSWLEGFHYLLPRKALWSMQSTKGIHENRNCIKYFHGLIPVYTVHTVSQFPSSYYNDLFDSVPFSSVLDFIDSKMQFSKSFYIFFMSSNVLGLFLPVAPYIQFTLI